MTQNRTKLIGLTGGIATGKSTVSKLLLQKGIPIIDADIVARQVVKVGKPAYNDIVENFGNIILNSDKSINRQKLGEIIFTNDELRLLLNRIVHPRVMEEIRQKINYISQNSDVIFLDIPLLIEEKDIIISSGIKIDQIWLVYTTEGIQIDRLMKRDDIDYQKALMRIVAQMPINEKKKLVDVIIDNTKGLEHLENQIDDLLKDF